MRTHKVLAAGAAVLGLALIFLAPGHAADDKDLRAALDKLVKTGSDKPDDLPKHGADFAKTNNIDNDSIKDVMDFLGKRDAKTKAWGVGKEEGAIKPDNIEMKIRDLAKAKPMSDKQLAKEGDALVEMARRTAAVGSVAIASAPKKDMPDKTIKDWKKYSEEMVKMSREFAKAVESKDGKAIKTAATNLNATCSDCHAKFRE